MLTNKYYIPYTVLSSMIDSKCRLTTLGMVLLAQDLAATHYGSCGLSIPQMQKKNLTWVITKQRFEIHEYPLWLDDVMLSTWANEPRGPFCFRYFSGNYAENGKKHSIETALPRTNVAEPNMRFSDALPFFNASSNWMVLDTLTGKPVKPDASVMGTLPFCPESPLAQSFPKITPPESWELTQELYPTILDIDLNSHVNNTNYVRWVLSVVPEQVYAGRLVSALDTYFIGQALFGEKLRVCASRVPGEDGEIRCVHAIFKEKDGSEVFRAQTVWKSEESLSRPII